MRPLAASLSRPSMPRRRRLFLERLEDRLALSGFGPEDGAYVVEPWHGNYRDVQVQASDQKIVTAGNSYEALTDGRGHRALRFTGQRGRYLWQRRRFHLRTGLLRQRLETPARWQGRRDWWHGQPRQVGIGSF